METTGANSKFPRRASSGLGWQDWLPPWLHVLGELVTDSWLLQKAYVRKQRRCISIADHVERWQIESLRNGPDATIFSQ